MTSNVLSLRATGYFGSLLGASLVTALLAPFHERINSTTVALAFLLVVLTRVYSRKVVAAHLAQSKFTAA